MIQVHQLEGLIPTLCLVCLAKSRITSTGYVEDPPFLCRCLWAQSAFCEFELPSVVLITAACINPHYDCWYFQLSLGFSVPQFLFWSTCSSPYRLTHVIMTSQLRSRRFDQGLNFHLMFDDVPTCPRICAPSAIDLFPSKFGRFQSILFWWTGFAGRTSCRGAGIASTASWSLTARGTPWKSCRSLGLILWKHGDTPSLSKHSRSDVTKWNGL